MNLATRIVRRQYRRAAGFVCLLLVGAGGLFHASAAVDEQTGLYALTVENDSLSNPVGPHQDRHYTAGMKMVLFGGDDFAPNLTDSLNGVANWGIQPKAGDLGVVFGQNIYTPEKILDPSPIPTDRPYAGWLYTGLVYQRRGELASNLNVMENFEVNLGVVGPDSIAEQAQKTIHRWWFSNDLPKGWGNQLRNEPGLELKYARLWRWSPAAALTNYFDVIPRVGGEVGNVQTFAMGGAALRLGFNLPEDFGVQIIDSPASANGGLRHGTPWFFAYAFGGLDGRAVGYDVTLDGNTFRSGPSVNKNVFVADVSYGAAVQIFRYVEITYTHIIRTEEFRGQAGNDILGSVTIKGKFCF